MGARRQITAAFQSLAWHFSMPSSRANSKGTKLSTFSKLIRLLWWHATFLLLRRNIGAVLKEERRVEKMTASHHKREECTAFVWIKSSKFISEILFLLTQVNTAQWVLTNYATLYCVVPSKDKTTRRRKLNAKTFLCGPTMPKGRRLRQTCSKLFLFITSNF